MPDMTDTEFKLDPNIKATWVAALRSGNFSQGTSVLRDVMDNYCCMGVFAEAVVAVEWAEDTISGAGVDDYDRRFTFNYDGEFYQHTFSCDLPPSWLPGPIQSKLITMNDNEKRSFNEIADWVEENL